ncbi:heterocyst frequency control protein PatD [Leptothoe spongobia]|uniref:Heterocyst frequency control protein PatD n=1 Tax=Leptothoe spongobia TAU-MAC 1115 TaxID=1967444 RepID=A0A947DGE2_9CYAN|nr:heterocyst frequency control protein PatD [Leptothoe spongobia]MBT9316174.1 heterocyst frequency control protein PatD [Leptothoe spongobia TAU-MAC 1115]
MTFTSAVEAIRRYEALLTQLQRAIGQASMPQKASGLQTFFTQNLWSTISQLDLPHQQSQWHAATTEIHRHMRLLAIEISFAQASRHGNTRQQRLAQIEQRLDQLQGFTQVLSNLLMGVQS